jgi:hypothetical protein
MLASKINFHRIVKYYFICCNNTESYINQEKEMPSSWGNIKKTKGGIASWNLASQLIR